LFSARKKLWKHQKHNMKNRYFVFLPTNDNRETQNRNCIVHDIIGDMWWERIGKSYYLRKKKFTASRSNSIKIDFFSRCIKQWHFHSWGFMTIYTHFGSLKTIMNRKNHDILPQSHSSGFLGEEWTRDSKGSLLNNLMMFITFRRSTRGDGNEKLSHLN
jgi:hypothetical protein